MDFLNKYEQEYLDSGKNLKDFPGLMSAIKTPRFTIKDLGVTPRDATYWSKQGILPNQTASNTTRRKYNLKQAVWIKLIQQLRSFEISLNKIKLIKNHLLETEINYLQLLEDDKVKELIEFIGKQNGDPIDIKAILSDPKIKQKLQEKSVDVYEMILLNALMFRNDVSIIAFSDGQCMPYMFSKQDQIKKSAPNFEAQFKHPHVLLSISQAFSKLIAEWNECAWFDDIELITKDERKVLKLLKDKNTKELKIYKKDNQLDRVIQVSNKEMDAIGQFADHIVRNGYQTMTISTRRGKPIHFRNEVSLKLNDIPE